MRRKSIIVMLAAAVMALSLTAFGGAKLDMGKYVTVSFAGADERGKMFIITDCNAMAEVINKKNKSNGSLAEPLKGTTLSNTITYSCDKKEGLKNGDVVTVTVNVPEELMKTYGFSVSNTQLTCKVENLTILEKVDAFADIDLHFSGRAPFATASLENNSDIPFLQNVTYELDRDSDLKNGDVVTVTAVYSEELAEEYLCIPESDTRAYTVEGLNSYITSFDDLSGNVPDEVLADSRDRVEALIAEKSTLCSKFAGCAPEHPDAYVVDKDNLKLLTSYLLVSKGAGFNADHCNVYINVYHTTGYIAPWVPLFVYNGDLYIAISYYDLEMNSDGKLNVDLAGAKYTYFTSEEDVYNDWMTSSKDRYKVYEQRADTGADAGTADVSDGVSDAAESDGASGGAAADAAEAPAA